MTPVQKAEALLSLQFAQNALGEVLVRAGEDRPAIVAESVHAAVELLQNAQFALRRVVTVQPIDKKTAP